MMDMLITLILGSTKAVVLLSVAAGAVLLLRRRSARLRAVVWATALAGSVLVAVDGSSRSDPCDSAAIRARAGLDSTDGGCRGLARKGAFSDSTPRGGIGPCPVEQ